MQASLNNVPPLSGNHCTISVPTGAATFRIHIRRPHPGIDRIALAKALNSGKNWQYSAQAEFAIATTDSARMGT